MGERRQGGPGPSFSSTHSFSVAAAGKYIQESLVFEEDLLA